jgi:hypothetical protein
VIDANIYVNVKRTLNFNTGIDWALVSAGSRDASDLTGGTWLRQGAAPGVIRLQTFEFKGEKGNENWIQVAAAGFCVPWLPICYLAALGNP